MTSEASNCQADIDNVLVDLSSFSQVSAPSQIRGTTLSDENVSVSSDESSALSTHTICTQNVASYMTGYPFKKGIVLFAMQFQIYSA